MKWFARSAHGNWNWIDHDGRWLVGNLYFQYRLYDNLFTYDRPIVAVKVLHQAKNSTCKQVASKQRKKEILSYQRKKNNKDRWYEFDVYLVTAD